MEAPPLLISFDCLERYFMSNGLNPKSPEGRLISRLVEKGLPPITSKTTVGGLFGYSPRFVGAMCRNPDRYYRTFYLQKGSSKRRIDAPRVALKVIQKWAGHHLAKNLQLPPCVVGFVPGISAIQGAARHCGSRWVFSTDIQDFFPTTSQALVALSLQKLGYDSRGAETFAKLACLDGHLAQGSPCSPVLSNICFTKVDKKLSLYADKHELTYTRYADDIVFSGRGTPPTGIEVFVTKCVESAGWAISKKKTRLAVYPNRLKVYGLLVMGDVPRLTKGYRNRIRALKHLAAHERLRPEDKAKAKGHLAYAASVDAFGDNDMGLV